MRRNNDFLDFCKFVFALMVVAIHSGLSIKVLGVDIVWPIVATAVPCFFILSSYFLYGKVFETPEDTRMILKKYVYRNLQLYCFWFFALLPLIVYIRWSGWAGGGGLFGPLLFLKSVFLGSTFVGSWFIMACVIGAVVVQWLASVMPIPCVLGLTGLVYLMICICKNYCAMSGFDQGVLLMGSAWFWLVCGMWFARWHKRGGGLVNIVALFAALLLLCLEWSLGHWKNGYYLSLMILVPSLFLLLSKVNVNVPGARFLRMASIIMFCSHHLWLKIIWGVESAFKLRDERNLFAFVLAVICGVLLTAIIHKVERMRRFNWLRFAH